MTTKNLKFKVTGDHIIVLEKEKQLFKVSNTKNNASQLLKLCRK